MYTIVNVVYGTPFEDASEKELNAIEYLEDSGLHSYYTGSGDYAPTIFGVELCEFDECQMALDVSTLQLVPTPEQIEEYHRLVDLAKHEVQQLSQSHYTPWPEIMPTNKPFRFIPMSQNAKHKKKVRRKLAKAGRRSSRK
jgi:hypothetical protein